MAERILRGKVNVVIAMREHGKSALSPCGDGDGCGEDPATCREMAHDPEEKAAHCDRFRQVIFVRE